jgi:NADH-quinone oxidoreductase subunit C
MADDDVRENVHEGDEGPESAVPNAPAAPEDPVAAAVLERFAGSTYAPSHGQAVVYVDAAIWHDLGLFLRDEQQFTQCIDITAVDQLLRPERPLPAGVDGGRFEVVANFLSHPRVWRIRAIAQLPAESPEISTLADLWPGVEYAEREVYDLFGITFSDHPDLTRILMPDDWVGYPLRKDFPSARVPVQFKENPRTT